VPGQHGMVKHGECNSWQAMLVAKDDLRPWSVHSIERPETTWTKEAPGGLAKVSWSVQYVCAKRLLKKVAPQPPGDLTVDGLITANAKESATPVSTIYLYIILLYTSSIN
jgi:hypothetical protein